MSITDEDLQYMADVMWDDALLPGIDADLGLHQLLSADEHVEGAANESDALLERRSKSKTPKPEKLVEKTPAAITSKGKSVIDWKRSAKPTASSAAATPAARAKADAKGKSKEKAGGKSAKSGVTIGDAGSSRDKAKLPPKLPTSPLSDLYLSSLPDTLVKPKVGGKLSKSMKGASQNEILAPEAGVRSADDPYEIPTSPESNKHNHEKSALNTKAASPTTSVAKMTSPFGLIPASDKKRLKPQKRVAKRSFLDAPEIPEKDENTKPAQDKPLQAKPPQVKPPPKAATKSKRKPPASKAKNTGKGKEKPAEKEKEEQMKKSVQSAQPTKAVVKVEKQEQLASRSFLIPKSEMDEDSTYDIPASVHDMPPAKEITKKLRPRSGKPAIVISSDSGTSYLDDDSASFAGDTTVMTTPDHHIEDFGQAKPKLLQDVASAVTPASTEGQMIFGRSFKKRPTEEAPTKTTNRSKKLQRQTGVDAMHSVTDHTANDAATVSYEVKTLKGELHNARGSEGLVSEQGLVEQARGQEKRHRSPTTAGKPDHNNKRPKLERSVSAYQRHDDADAGDDRDLMQLQRSSSKVVQSVAESDPFVGDLDEERPQQSQFTSKLLRSTVEPASDIEQSGSSRAASRQSQISMATNTPCAGRNVPASSNAYASHVPQGVSAESSQIAREMMQLLQSSHRAGSGQGQKNESGSAKDIWLDETDPYKETTQVMGYVCKTLLRFLKSKEAAIEDVATEYRQRGGAVITNIKELHGNERRKFALELEEKRQHSLDMFEEASRGVHKIAASLERVSLVPAINNILADNTVSRLKALQTEVA